MVEILNVLVAKVVKGDLTEGVMDFMDNAMMLKLNAHSKEELEVMSALVVVDPVVYLTHL
jgi:hypothetical protein